MDRLIDLLASCYHDPDRFNTAILARPPYWRPKQYEAALSVARYRDTAVYSGNAVGKDYLVGGLIPWWLYTRENALVVVTGPSQRQLGLITWKEVSRAIEGMPFPTRAHVTRSAIRSPQEVILPGGGRAVGFCSTEIERVSGFHGRQLLVVIEEASGVDAKIWEALDSLGYHRLLAIGNPIRPDGRFVDLIRQAARDQRDGVPPGRACNAIRIASTESPHAHLDRSPVGLADATFLTASGRRYGVPSLWWDSHIEAKIPQLGTAALLELGWVEVLTHVPRPVWKDRDRRDPRAGLVRLGIDLAEGVGADDSVIVCRDDHGILEVWHDPHVPRALVAREAARMKLQWKAQDDQIFFDCSGIGRDFQIDLKREGIKAQPYNGSGTPREPAQFTNLRSECAWNLRRRLDPNWYPDKANGTQSIFHVPPGSWWPRLRAELLALHYELVEGNKTALEEKEKMKARLGGQSPDLADALLMTFVL